MAPSCTSRIKWFLAFPRMTRLVTKQQSPRASHVLATIRVKDVKMFSVAGDLYPARCRPQIRFHLVNLASYWETYSHCYLFHFLSSGFFFLFYSSFRFLFLQVFWGLCTWWCVWLFIFLILLFLVSSPLLPFVSFSQRMKRFTFKTIFFSYHSLLYLIVSFLLCLPVLRFFEPS